MTQFGEVLERVVEGEEFEQFRLNAQDFLSARQQGGTAGTQIAQLAVSLSEAAQALNQSAAEEKPDEEGYTNVISPVVMPKDSRSLWWVLIAGFIAVVGLIGLSVGAATGQLVGAGNIALILFGPHYWLVWLGYVGLSVWRYSHVMIPDGCHALITKYGRVEETVGPGKKWLFHPRKKVGYIVNTTREYPYNAPIRQAPTKDRVEASIDLFIQFRIEDASEFIFRLGGVNGFSEKLHNAISETTRALIYEQQAQAIYDLVGESTQSLVEALNTQFLPAVRFVNASITHAEPSSQEYRMDLAAAEIVRASKEAYTYEYELDLRKKQDEGDLNKELARLRETLSEIRADIATYQAQIDTAKERAVNRANAYARQLMIEAESEAQANAALLQAQALDYKAVNSASYPEILEYRYRQQTLDRIEAVADKLPQIVNIGPAKQHTLDYMTLAQQMMGVTGQPLYSPEHIEAIRRQLPDIMTRIEERTDEIKALMAEVGQEVAESVDEIADKEIIGEILADDESVEEAAA